jgi:hypothetical protein
MKQKSMNTIKQVVAASAVVVLAAASAAAQAPRQSEADQIRARQRISMMEGTLERAVLNGADNLVRQVDRVMPDGAMLTGAPQVRGFRLEGYGVFFDVEVPALRLSIAWMVRAMQAESQMASAVVNDLRRLASSVSGRERASLEQIVRQLDVMLGAGASAVVQPPAPPRMAAAPGGVGAASVAPQAPPAQAEPIVQNPNAIWTREVQTALIDAMLENSVPLGVADEEWLTVAARDNAPSDPLVPGDTVDLNTMIFRVKGSDLAAFHSRRITIEEARTRVEIREY